MKKAFISTVTIGAMTATVLAGCTGSGEDTTSGGKEVLKIWSFTDELKKPIKKFKEKNDVKVKLTIVPMADYPTKLKPALESGVGAPDIFTGEIAFLKQWVDAGYWANLSEKPFNADDVAKDYIPYVFDMGKDKEGNVRALSWQTTPGGIYYKRSIAKKVLGTDDPKKIGGMMNSMDGVFEVADKMKQKGYKMFPDEGSIRWFVQGNDPQPWVNDKQELVLTDARKEYMDYAKELRTKQYTALAPNAFKDLIRRLRAEYTDLPIYITENGAAFDDELIEGRVADQNRIDYVAQHLQAISDLNEEGMNIDGYYLWSLLDNFEWSFGYEKRFGILYVDFETQERIWKDSAHWYANVIKRHKATLPQSV